MNSRSRNLKLISILMMTMALPKMRIPFASGIQAIQIKAKKGFKLFGVRFFANDSASIDSLVEIAIGVTILLIVLAYIFAPVGLVAYQSTNLTSAGLTSGTAGLSIWNAIVPVSMAVIILALVTVIKKAN